MAIDYTWLEEKILLRKLDADERNKLGNLLVEKQCAKGEKILTQGQQGGVLYLLRSGSAEIRAESGGQEIRISTAREGALFGEMTFLTGESASATVVALEDCVVYKLRRADTSELMQSEPEIVYAFLAYMLVYAGKVIRTMNEEHAMILQYMTSSHK
ncbi:MAG TPA: cyclic nucleotide-binding domain-containing protein [Mariprofundaceae bacterium]|nr:cyclic nucleotide-binding domain-containing protein [Mariprofundaceae bacterium]